ncbi:MAG: hypothetical protein ACF8OB_03025 [Phycisphaeraceae bacterium JB051]
MSNYDSNGNLKRSAMEQTIKTGGSVMIGGKTITKIDDLPQPEKPKNTEQQKPADDKSKVPGKTQTVDKSKDKK